MKPRHVRRLITVCIAAIALYSVGIWQWGFPYIYINYSKSTSLAPHAIPWTELGLAVQHEEGEAKVLDLIHKNPAQLTMLQPPSPGYLPLEIAITDGANNITALLLFEYEKIYDPEDLIRIAKHCIRRQEIDHLRMLRSVVPNERADWYIAQLEDLLTQAGLEEIGSWPTELDNITDANQSEP